MKSASIYCHNDMLLFVVNSRFKDGIIRKTTNMEAIGISTPSEDLALNLVKCFERFEEGNELVAGMDKEFRFRLSKLAGCNSYKRFVAESNLIELIDTGSEVKIQPLKSSKKFLGYESYGGIIEQFKKEDLAGNIVLDRLKSLFDEMRGSREETM